MRLRPESHSPIPPLPPGATQAADGRRDYIGGAFRPEGHAPENRG